jgi:antitoxin component of MazEF toxin-antitoxin module
MKNLYRKNKKAVNLAKPKSTLKQLLAKVTAENIHQEIETGPAIGKEGW